MCWTDHLDARDVVDPDFALRVDAVVDELLAVGLSAVLDVHHADAVHADPTGQGVTLETLWRWIARRYAEHPAALVLDLLNEPRPPMTASQWNLLAARLVAAVRTIDTTRTVLVGPAAAGTVRGLADLELPTDEHLALTVHYYDPMPFTHQGAWWEPGAEQWRGTRWGSDEDREAVTRDLEHVAGWAFDRGVDVLLGEFGTIDLAVWSDRAAWTRWVRQEDDRLGLAWCAWSLGGDFGLHGPDGWDQALVDALLGCSFRE